MDNMGNQITQMKWTNSQRDTNYMKPTYKENEHLNDQEEECISNQKTSHKGKTMTRYKLQ